MSFMGMNIGALAGRAAGFGGGGEQQRYTQDDFKNYTPGGDYGAAPTYDWEANKQGGWKGMVGHLERAVAGQTPGGMESYNRRQYLQQQQDLNDPQMASIFQGRDDWKKDPGMVDEMWGDVNKFYGNPTSGGAGAEGLPPGVTPNETLGATGQIKKTAGAMKKGMPQRHAMGAAMGAMGGQGGTNIGQMAKASRTSSYGR